MRQRRCAPLCVDCLLSIHHQFSPHLIWLGSLDVFSLVASCTKWPCAQISLVYARATRCACALPLRQPSLSLVFPLSLFHRLTWHTWQAVQAEVDAVDKIAQGLAFNAVVLQVGSPLCHPPPRLYCCLHWPQRTQAQVREITEHMC